MKKKRGRIVSSSSSSSDEEEEGKKMEKMKKKRQKKKPDTSSLLKSKSHLFQDDVFSVMLFTILEQESKDLQMLLRPNTKWNMSPSFIQAMNKELSRLLKRIVEKSSFFGKYRILSITDDPYDKKPGVQKPQLNVKESDFNFGYRTLKSDVMGE
jgi:hypothetical protein